MAISGPTSSPLQLPPLHDLIRRSFRRRLFSAICLSSSLKRTIPAEATVFARVPGCFLFPFPRGDFLASRSVLVGSRTGSSPPSPSRLDGQNTVQLSWFFTSVTDPLCLAISLETPYVAYVRGRFAPFAPCQSTFYDDHSLPDLLLGKDHFALGLTEPLPYTCSLTDLLPSPPGHGATLR